MLSIWSVRANKIKFINIFVAFLRTQWTTLAQKALFQRIHERHSKCTSNAIIVNIALNLGLPLFWRPIHVYEVAISIHLTLLQPLSDSFLVAIYHSWHHPNFCHNFFVFSFDINSFVRSFKFVLFWMYILCFLVFSFRFISRRLWFEFLFFLWRRKGFFF